MPSHSTPPARPGADAPRPAAGAAAPASQPAAVPAIQQAPGGEGRAEQGGSYLQLILRVKENGQASVVSAVQVQGRAIVANAKAGDFVYEVTDKERRPVVIRSLPNPFEGRAFPAPPTPNDPQGKPEGHHQEHGKEATITVRVPNMTLEQAVASDLSIKLYKIKPGPQAVTTLSPNTMNTLRAANRLEVRNEIPANRLGPELQRVGRKLEEKR